MSNQPEPDRSLLLLAAGIVEWAGALQHLDALEKMGLYDPYRRPTPRRSTRSELDQLIERWPYATDITRTRANVVEEARQYVTKHQQHLDDLLEEGE